MKAFVFPTIIFLLLTLSSCKLTEKNIAGIYYLKGSPKTTLVLNKNKTFEFVKNLSKPGVNIFSEPIDLNFRTSGNWQLNPDKKLVLTSSGLLDKSPASWASSSDTVSQNTTATSFIFWDQYGDPVPIRFVKFLPDRVKFHLNNSISFFAEDFKQTDTIEFYFNGYLPYTWSEKSVGNELRNNNHKIILYEQNRQGFFKDLAFTVKRRKLISADKHFTLTKTQ